MHNNDREMDRELQAELDNLRQKQREILEKTQPVPCDYCEQPAIHDNIGAMHLCDYHYDHVMEVVHDVQLEMDAQAGADNA